VSDQGIVRAKEEGRRWERPCLGIGEKGGIGGGIDVRGPRRWYCPSKKGGREDVDN
jgi:hypothetical protein